MSQTVTYSVAESIAVLTIQNPPVNALNASVRTGLAQGLDRALEDPAVRAIVLLGQGAGFSAGADITEFDRPFEDPSLPDLCTQFEKASKPVIAGIHGIALGGGLELALACHYRVANASARIALPEIKLGLLPGAGGTQRLPRLLGAHSALSMIMTGQQISVQEQIVKPLFDLVAEADVKKVALAYADKVVEKGLSVRRTRDLNIGMTDVMGYQSEITRWRKELGPRATKPQIEIMRCVEAAGLLSFDIGLKFEWAAFAELQESEQSKSLCHLYFAERRARKFPELRVGQARPVQSVGVIGAGRRASGFAVASLVAGLDVVLVAETPQEISRARSFLGSILNRFETQGVLNERQRLEAEERLLAGTNMSALREADLVLEADGHDPGRRIDAFGKLANIVDEQTIFVTASPFADLERLSAEFQTPHRVLSLFANIPTQVSPMAEVGVPVGADPDVVATVVNYVSRIGKTPLHCRPHVGLIGNRIAAAAQLAMDRLVLSGTSHVRIDEVLRSWGMSRGVYQIADGIGLARVVERQRACGVTHSPDVHQALIEAGRSGRAEKAGWYRYDAEHPMGQADPAVAEIVARLRDDHDGALRVAGPEEIRTRFLAAMVNHGACLLKEGVAQRPSDIDVSMVFGFGFPKWRGGPMHAADRFGLTALRNLIRSYAEEDPDFWTPEPHFDLLIKNGQGFDSLNR